MRMASRVETEAPKSHCAQIFRGWDGMSPPAALILRIVFISAIFGQTTVKNGLVLYLGVMA